VKNKSLCPSLCHSQASQQNLSGRQLTERAKHASQHMTQTFFMLRMQQQPAASNNDDDKNNITYNNNAKARSKTTKHRPLKTKREQPNNFKQGGSKSKPLFQKQK
jgi:hypothetical protein